MQGLVTLLSKKFDQHWFSLKFKDPSIEMEFQKFFHRDMTAFATTYFRIILVIFIMIAIVVIYSLFVQAKDKWKFPLVSLCLMGLFTGFSYGLLRWSRINLTVSKYYSSIQLIQLIVIFVEINILVGSAWSQQGWGVVFCLQALVSCISYCKKEQFFVLLGVALYATGRTYVFIPRIAEMINFNYNFWMSQAILYVTSRTYTQNLRAQFTQMKNQEQLLVLFTNLVKVYHDGIIMTSKEEIILYNQSTENIFCQTDESSLAQQSHLSKYRVNQPDTQGQIGIPLKKDQKKPSLAKIDLEQGCGSGRKQQNQQCGTQTPKSIKNSSEKNTPHFSPKFQERTTLSIIAGMHKTLKSDADPENLSLWEYINKLDRDYEVQQDTGERNSINEGGQYFTIQSRGGTGQQDERIDQTLLVFTNILNISGQQIVLTTVRDMSNFIELEKQKNMTKLKTIAFASAAHEFRNPLNAIESSLTILEPYIDQKRCGKFFQIAKDCSSLMVFLVRDILDLSQMEAKSIILNIQECSLRNLVQECMRVFQMKAQDKGIKLEIQNEDSMYWPPKLNIDENRTKQIIINLLSNALKYTVKGHVLITTTVSKDHRKYGIIVEDSGVGMTEAQVQRLFTPFTKIMANRELNVDGVGLGLSISLNIARALGGDMEVDSVKGKGSTFTLWLPLSQKNIQDYDCYLAQETHFESDRKKFIITDEVDPQIDDINSLSHINKQFLQKSLKQQTILKMGSKKSKHNI
ncbi:hypothetical protein FGO68_gene9762 [Halteria grandinella]|uniref:histidine kinase n=1 Tax=Halteria grandinella TaxID=5974 RepID=A0A8J8P089_HALGN|nr:hypothetical protein FGO68_gene9762 [Halteria grandinella]